MIWGSCSLLVCYVEISLLHFWLELHSDGVMGIRVNVGI
jgi:hypothetical protein